MVKPNFRLVLGLIGMVSVSLFSFGCGSGDSESSIKDPNYQAPLDKKTTPGAGKAAGGAADKGKSAGGVDD